MFSRYFSGSLTPNKSKYNYSLLARYTLPSSLTKLFIPPPHTPIVSSLKLYVGGPVPTTGQYQAKAPFNPVTSGGRTITIIAVNGVACSVTASVDTGNNAFISYSSGSPLIAALSFPFNITLTGGSTLSFQSAPYVNGTVTKADLYKDVLALGFLSAFTTVFDDTNSVVYFV